jgi:hypothetical protein
MCTFRYMSGAPQMTTVPPIMKRSSNHQRICTVATSLLVRRQRRFLI